jgi:hypothetical protein
VPFFSLIDPSASNILDQDVVAAGTEGYVVVLSLAEVDPAFGGSTALNQIDLVLMPGRAFPVSASRARSAGG